MGLYSQVTDMLPSRIKPLARSIIPARLHGWLRGNQKNLKRRPAVGKVRFGELRRLQPIDRIFGMNWGQPIDRYFIEKFLAQYSTDIKGTCLKLETTLIRGDSVGKM